MSALTQLSHQQNKNKMVFNSEDLILIKVLCQEIKVTTIDE